MALPVRKLSVDSQQPKLAPCMRSQSAQIPLCVRLVAAAVPMRALPGPDLIAALIPAALESRTVWHFDLVVENTDADQVLLRAEVARDRLAAADAKRAADRKPMTAAGLAAEVEAEGGTGRPGAPVEGAPVPVADPVVPANSNLGQDPLIDPDSAAD